MEIPNVHIFEFEYETMNNLENLEEHIFSQKKRNKYFDVSKTSQETLSKEKDILNLHPIIMTYRNQLYQEDVNFLRQNNQDKYAILIALTEKRRSVVERNNENFYDQNDITYDEETETFNTELNIKNIREELDEYLRINKNRKIELLKQIDLEIYNKLFNYIKSNNLLVNSKIKKYFKRYKELCIRHFVPYEIYSEEVVNIYFPNTSRLCNYVISK